MNRLFFSIGIILFGAVISTQEIQHEVIAINIEVPVRVFKGDTFIGNLTIDDFEIYEDGVLQKIEAVYLIKQKDIIRKEEVIEKKHTPETKRTFILYFQIRDNLPKINEAIEYFFENVLLPGDALIIVTPIKSYRFKETALEKLPKEEILNQLKVILRRDIRSGSDEYRSLVKELETIIMTEGIGGLKESMCMTILRRMLAMDFVDDPILYKLAEDLKQTNGQKHVFLFYQKSIIPIPTFLGSSLELLHKDVSFDVDKTKKIFSDSSITCHFMFISNTPLYMIDITRGVSYETLELKMEDRSSDVFSALSELAKTTGGLVTSSANAASAFKEAVKASENYYLLYYTPKKYIADGKYRKIEVKVKEKKYRILHRAGYVAD